MTARVSMKTKRREAPEWVFPWKPRGEPAFPKLLAFVAVALAFGFFLTSVRIHTAAPVAWSNRKASLIHAIDDAEGRALTLRARDGGPFPSRFEPTDWPAYATLEKAAMEAARTPQPAYRPALRDLADDPPATHPALAEPGAVVLPRPRPPEVAAQTAPALVLQPVILPISGIRAEAIPRDLPPFTGPADAQITAEPPRFLLRLDAAGTVLDCIALDGGDEAGPSALEKWLRGIPFKPDPAKASRWISVRVSFINQPADGTDAR